MKIKDISERKKTKIVKISLLVITILILVGLFLYYNGPSIKFSDFKVNPEELAQRVRQRRGPLNCLLLTLFIALVVIIPGIPVVPFAILTGIVYGPFLGFAMNLSGMLIANISMMFLIKNVKRFGQSKSNSDDSSFLDKISSFKHPKLGLASSYIIPVMPNFLIDFTAVKLGYSIKDFFLYIILGNIPMALLYALGGDAIMGRDLKTIIRVVLIIMLPILLYKFLDKIYEKDRKNHE